MLNLDPAVLIMGIGPNGSGYLRTKLGELLVVVLATPGNFTLPKSLSHTPIRRSSCAAAPSNEYSRESSLTQKFAAILTCLKTLCNMAVSRRHEKTGSNGVVCRLSNFPSLRLPVGP